MSFNLSQFTEKTSSKDKDLRHMALYDLLHDLEKESFKLDDTTQKKVSETVIALLEDTSSEVQGMAVKCLEPMVRKLPANQVETCIQKLTATVMGEDEDKRDIATIAMKIIVTKIPAEVALNPIKKALSLLTKALDKNTSQEVKIEALDIFSEILARFGGVLSFAHEELQNAFIRELSSTKPALRKRSISALAALSQYSSDDLFKKLFSTVISGIAKEEKGGDGLRTYIQLCSAISKAAGYRLGKYLKEIVPLLVKSADAISENEKEDEVRENIMQAFDSFLQTCPDESKEHVEMFVILAKEYLEYDPNYSYDSSDEENDELEQEETHQDDDQEEGGFSDDDDISWKVRKAAAKCLNTIVKTRPEYLDAAYDDLASMDEDKDYLLISRFKEREESVKLDIFEVFVSLLKQTCIVGPTGAVIGQKDSIKKLRLIVDVVMSRIKKQLKEKSIKVRQGAFSVLKELVVTLQGGLDKHIASLITPIASALTDSSNSSLRLEVLAFLENLLRLHKPSNFTAHYAKISKAVFTCVSDRFYKVITLSLKVCGELVRVIASDKTSKSYESDAAALYKAIYDRLVIQDIDKDVKEASIEAIGAYIAQIGTKKEVAQALPVLLERLKNEITKLTTSRTLSTIALANVDVSLVLKGVIEELAGMLRKTSRSLRQAGLITLADFVVHYHKDIDVKLVPVIISEVANLLNNTKDSDLSLSQLAFDLTVNLLTLIPNCKNDVVATILPVALNLLESSTLQGACLKSFTNLLTTLVPSVGFSKLLESVLATLAKMKGQVSKQIYVNVGKCVAALGSSPSVEKDFKTTIEKFVKDISSKDESTKLLALFTLGEVGISTDLSSYKTLKGDIESCFDSGSEEVKTAASTCLGHVTVGSMDSYLPSLLDSIKSDVKKRYLLLHSLKEVITQSPAEKLKNVIKDVVPLLFSNCDNEEEGIRNVVAECLGKLATVEYKTVIDQLKAKLSDKSEEVKSTIISAVKYTITEKQRPFDNLLKSDIAKFLRDSLKKKEHHKVRRAGVLLLTSAIHTKPVLVADRLVDLLPDLYANSVTDQSLIRKVDVGPFKIDVDDGLDLRKSVFECMDTLLESCVSRIDVIKFAANLPHGLNDINPDIKMLSHMMLIKLAEVAPSSVLTVVDDLCEPLKETLNGKLKENAVQTEKERHNDMIKSALKAIWTVGQVKGVQDSIKFTDLINKVVKANSNLDTMYESIASGKQEKHE